MGRIPGLVKWIGIRILPISYKYTDVSFTPVRVGYQFEGWYLDENFSQKFYGFQDDRDL